MTKFELTQLFWLQKEIQAETQHLEELKAAAESSTSKLSVTPYSGSKAHGRENSLITYVDQTKLVENKIASLTTLYRQLTSEIEAIPDSYMRQILTLRYVSGMSWLQVAMRIGGGNTADSVRKAHDRFLKKQ